MTWITLIAGVASSGAMVGVLTWWSTRKKTPVEVDNLIVAGAKETVGMQGDLLIAMREDIVRLRDQMAEERATREREMQRRHSLGKWRLAKATGSKTTTGWRRRSAACSSS